MNSNPAKAKVLYIEVHEETGYLEKRTDKIIFFNKVNIIINVI